MARLVVRPENLPIHWENEDDVMGRLVVGTGEEVGGKACFFIVFFYIFGRLGQEKSTKIAAKVKTEEKTEK